MSIPVMSSKSGVLMAEAKLTVFWALLPEEKTTGSSISFVCVCVYTTSHGITPQKTVMFTVTMFQVALKA
jgi:hypothetical protein